MKARLRQFWKKERWILLHLLSPLIIWSALGFPWYAKNVQELQQAGRLEQKIILQHQRLQGLEENINNQKNLLFSFDSLHQQAKNRVSKFQLAPDSLRRLAENQGLRVHEIQVQSQNSPAGLKLFRKTFGLQLSGRYNSWANFSLLLDSQYPHLRLEQADLQQRNQTLHISALWAVYQEAP